MIIFIEEYTVILILSNIIKNYSVYYYYEKGREKMSSLLVSKWMYITSKHITFGLLVFRLVVGIIQSNGIAAI